MSYYAYPYVEIHRAARRHGVQDEDLAHAYAHAIAWAELGTDPVRYLVAGPDRSGKLLELVVLDTGSRALVIHAMGLRLSTREALFGDSER